MLFRRDLRIADNAALAAAAERSAPVMALFVLDEESEGVRPMGAASRWWLHRSLEALGKDLRRMGAMLLLARGRTDEVVSRAVAARSCVRRST